MKRIACLLTAELSHRLTLLRRYALGTAADVLTFYLVFVGVHFSIRSIVGEVGAADLQRLATSQVVGFLAFYFASMVLSSIGNYLREGVEEGTLEQLFLAPHPFLLVLGARLLSTFLIDVLRVIPLFFLLTATTGVRIAFTPAGLLIFFVLLVGVYGFAVLLGGLTLLFKRTGQLPFLFQVLFLGLGFSSFDGASTTFRAVASVLPFARGVALLKSTVVDPGPIGSVVASAGFLELGLNALGYVLIGVLFFAWSERVAKDRGLLGRY
jgi:ABC-2 type transport system permease protein